MAETIEEMASKAILQQAEEVEIAGKTYSVAPPSIATLILISQEISKLPNIKLDSNNILMEALSVAKDCEALGNIVATIVLGAKGLIETSTVEEKRFFGLITKRITVTTDRRKELAKSILEDVTPNDLHILLIQLFSTLQVSDFFGITTSLIEINLLRQTREVVSKTTASGRL